MLQTVETSHYKSKLSGVCTPVGWTCRPFRRLIKRVTFENKNTGDVDFCVPRASARCTPQIVTSSRGKRHRLLGASSERFHEADTMQGGVLNVPWFRNAQPRSARGMIVHSPCTRAHAKHTPSTPQPATYAAQLCYMRAPVVLTRYDRAHHPSNPNPRALSTRHIIPATKSFTKKTGEKKTEPVRTRMLDYLP